MWQKRARARSSSSSTASPNAGTRGATSCPSSPAAATGAPLNDPAKFTTLHVVGDLVSLIDAVAPAGEKVLVVGHDWGSMIAWALCLYRPDKVRAVVNMSVPFTRRNPSSKPIETLRSVYGDEYYMIRFQEVGRIEDEFAEIGSKTVFENVLTNRNPGIVYLPKGKPFPAESESESDTPTTLPSWLSQEDIDYYATKYDAAGFTAPLNYYRALDINWEVTAPWTGSKIQVPVKFIIGDLDSTYNAPGAKEYIHKGGFKQDCPLLKDPRREV